MKTERAGRCTITYYDSIEELPIERYHRYNKYLIIDNNIGADIPSLMTRTERAQRYIGMGKSAEALMELDNMRQAIAFIDEEINPSHLAFAVLIHSIDGKERNDISSDGLKKTLDEIKDAQLGIIGRLLQSVKKKIEEEMLQYFPELTNDTRTKEYYMILKEYTQLTLKSIIDGDGEITDEMNDIAGQLITYTDPQKFYGQESAEVKYDKQYENMCIMIKKNTGVDAKNSTTLSYFQSYMFVREQANQQRKEMARSSARK